MGLGNKLIVSATGFPGSNKTWRFVQDAYREPLGSLAQLAGEKTIITGVVVNDSDPNNVTVSNGFITYNGEIIPFVGGAFVGTVTVIETIENVRYNTDADNNLQLDSLPAYRTISARCGTGGIDIFPFTDLKTLKTIKELSSFSLPDNLVVDANYVHTDNNFTVELLQKLNFLEQPDWNEVNPLAGAYIKNKPLILSPLRIGSSWIGDIIGIDESKTIYFPSVGTSNYMVIASFVSRGVDGFNVQTYYLPGWNWDNDFTYIIHHKEHNSFSVGFRELSAVMQDIEIQYILIPT